MQYKVASTQFISLVTDPAIHDNKRKRPHPTFELANEKNSNFEIPARHLQLRFLVPQRQRPRELHPHDGLQAGGGAGIHVRRGERQRWELRGRPGGIQGVL